MAVLLSGCMSTPDIKVYAPEQDETIAIVYIDMSQAKTPAHYGWLQSDQPINSRTHFQVFSKEDKKLGTILYAQKLKPGRYSLESIGGSTYLSRMEYSLGSEKTPFLQFNVNKQGVIYLGSYKYIQYKTKLNKSGDFEIKKTKGPSEKEVLAAFLKQTDDKQVAKLIQKRLGRLK